MNEFITVELNFHDLIALQAAGLQVPQPAQLQCLPGAIPNAGDVISHASINYPATNERARFRVVSRAHLFGGSHTQRIQLNLELVVLHRL